MGKCFCSCEFHECLLPLQCSSNRRDLIADIFISFNIFSLLFLKKNELIEHIEQLTFWAGDNEKLHFAKQELLAQIVNLDFSITGNGFFFIDRKSLANVSFPYIFMYNVEVCMKHDH